jgi:hypothetical protein
MFYKALGFAVWKLGMRYARKRMPSGAGKVALGLGVATAGAAAYLAATRSGSR